MELGLEPSKVGQVEEPVQGERKHRGRQGGGPGGELNLLCVAAPFLMPPQEQGHIAVSGGWWRRTCRWGDSRVFTLLLEHSPLSSWTSPAACTGKASLVLRPTGCGGPTGGVLSEQEPGPSAGKGGAGLASGPGVSVAALHLPVVVSSPLSHRGCLQGGQGEPHGEES